MSASLKGLVLAGGRSRRMGRDKALLRHGAESQLAYAVRLLEGYADEVFVSTRADQGNDPERARYARIVDRYEDLGPAAGILSAFDHDPAAAWLVLACDLPNVDGPTLDALIAGRDPSRPFTAFRSSHNDLPEPLCAIYEPSARALIARFTDDGVSCPRKMMINSETRLLVQPDPQALDNVNTPDDLERSRLGAGA